MSTYYDFMSVFFCKIVDFSFHISQREPSLLFQRVYQLFFDFRLGVFEICASGSLIMFLSESGI